MTDYAQRHLIEAAYDLPMDTMDRLAVEAAGLGISTSEHLSNIVDAHFSPPKPAPGILDGIIGILEEVGYSANFPELTDSRLQSGVVIALVALVRHRWRERLAAAAEKPSP